VEPLRIGVIGATGFADRIAIPEFARSSKIRIVAVQGRDEGRVRSVAERHGVPRWVTRVDELLAMDDLDAVYVCSPVFQHAEHVIAAARAGKHVLCEKPMGLTSDECRAMASACKEAGVVLIPAFMMRFNPAHMRMRELIEPGAVRRVVSLRAQFGFWYPEDPRAWRQVRELAGAGALVDVGSHCIDLVRFLAREIAEVSAQVSTLHFSCNVDDASVLLLRLQSGALAVVDVYFNTPSVENRLEIAGTRATIVAKGTIGALTHSRFRVLSPEGVEQVELTYESPYTLEIERFADVIRGRAQPIVTDLDGIRCQEVIEAAVRSSQTKQAVQL